MSNAETKTNEPGHERSIVPVENHRALIDQAKRDHVERLGWTWTSDGKQVDDPNQPHRCRLDNERWPCLPARLAEALEQATEEPEADLLEHYRYSSQVSEAIRRVDLGIKTIEQGVKKHGTTLPWDYRLPLDGLKWAAGVLSLAQRLRARLATVERDRDAAQQAATAEAALHDLTRAERDAARKIAANREKRWQEIAASILEVYHGNSPHHRENSQSGLCLERICSNWRQEIRTFAAAQPGRPKGARR